MPWYQQCYPFWLTTIKSHRMHCTVFLTGTSIEVGYDLSAVQFFPHLWGLKVFVCHWCLSRIHIYFWYVLATFVWEKLWLPSNPSAVKQCSILLSSHDCHNYNSSLFHTYVIWLAICLHMVEGETIWGFAVSNFLALYFIVSCYKVF